MFPDTSTAELSVEDVSHRWPNGQQALNHCNLVIPGPGLWMLVGSNGSGKSTLFRLISGLLESQSGRIACRTKTALVFQNPDHQLLLPSCGSDLMLGMDSQGPQQHRQSTVRDLLSQFGLAQLENRPIHSLSGGQKQRLAIAGALASDAGLLLLDEPTALLDPSSQTTVLNTVQRLCKDPVNPVTALWITHRLGELAFADGAARMQDGRIGAWTRGAELRRRLQGGTFEG
ncbi:ABC transporter ATP-binding protein [Synechococcus sp. MU1643]|uniref:ABC transporter ATP-binding protein n=1 Tax=Synechococcus sp. MU1643 TaxID=2508349 RepID=UPI001CF8D808|nr:ABC transporter ATP-binding protein [Synechococcus sp. MU1643]MCB4428336.1 ABC transporter ATP-binding protein [Synechococcus sp. MU1643]